MLFVIQVLNFVHNLKFYVFEISSTLSGGAGPQELILKSSDRAIKWGPQRQTVNTEQSLAGRGRYGNIMDTVLDRSLDSLLSGSPNLQDIIGVQLCSRGGRIGTTVTSQPLI